MQNKQFRIIPALAGNTMEDGTNRVWGQDHPRSRGEYPANATADLDEKGSSPLSRGILHLPFQLKRFIGIIPALAGNTRSRAEALGPYQDHPRSRGEYIVVDVDSGVGVGSSPLSRGIRSVTGCHNQGRGIIPALAGNTTRIDHPSAGSWDHPRSRGEYDNLEIYFYEGEGSSPLSRGIPGGFIDSLRGRRIIPALAGNTRGFYRLTQRGWDHPRSRGEYQGKTPSWRGFYGSSPLSRGILAWPAPCRGGRRIIPALAGNTAGDDHGSTPSRDHPRSRGEYFPLDSVT